MRREHAANRRRWPTACETLLLRASLLEGDDALDAWQEWKATVEFEQLEWSSQRLLPLLYRNLVDHGVADDLIGRLRGAYKLTWYKNQLLFRESAEALRSLHHAGIETMLIKGVALTLLHYGDHGLRPMGDLDVLVPRNQASLAVQLLATQGWSPSMRPLDRFTELYFLSRHAHGFEAGTGRTLDLHWHLLHECCSAISDEEFWRRAIPIEIDDVPTHALDPTDQLFHISVQGIKWDSVPPLHQAADAMTILHTAGHEIDWDRFVMLCQERRMTLPARASLTYLRDVVDAPIPSGVFESIRQVPVSRLEEFEHEVRIGSPRPVGPLRQLLLYYVRYSRQAKGMGGSRRLTGFPRFLRSVWDLDHRWQLPIAALVRGVRVTSRMIAWHCGRLSGVASPL